MFKFLQCIICHKRKKDNEKTKKIEYYSRHRYRTRCRVHLSCIEDPIKNPENYPIDIVDTCIDLANHFEEKFAREELDRKTRQLFEEQVMKDVKTINLELFLSKAKGNNITKG